MGFMESGWRFCTKSLIYLFLAAVLLVTQVSAGNCAGDVNVEVEIETGPEFHSSDPNTIWGCVELHYKNKFPFDFLTEPSTQGLTCPSATFFGRDYELCWLLDIFHLVEPAMILGMLISAVLWL